MKKRHTRLTGFTIVEPLLGLILLVLVGFIAYFVHHVNNSATDTYNDANNTSAAPVIRHKNHAPHTTSLQNSYNDVVAGDSQTTTDINATDAALAN